MKKVGKEKEMRKKKKMAVSLLTTRNVYDWRKKPYHHEGGTTSKRWKRRPRLVASEFAFSERKRDDIFSPATSGTEASTYNLLAESQ